MRSVFITLKVQIKFSLSVLTMLALLFHSGSSFAQANFIFDHLPTEEKGLKQSSINTLVLDDEGFVWIGTQEGLFKFDGNQYQHFSNLKTNDRRFLAPYIYNIEKRNSNELWLNTRTGIKFFDINQQVETPLKWQNEKDQSNNKIKFNPIKISNDKIYTWGNSSIFQLYKNKNEIKKELFFDASEIECDFTKTRNFQVINGHTFIACGENILQIDSNGILIHKFLYKEAKFKHVFCRENGQIYLSSAFKGLYELDLKTQKIKPIPELFFNEEEISITDFLEDSMGNLWIASKNGLYHLKQGKSFDQIQLFQSQPNYPSSLRNNLIHCLIEDHSGNILIGTDTGIDIIQKYKSQFSRLDANKSNPFHLNNGNTFMVFLNKQKELWSTSFNGVHKISFDKKLQNNFNDFRIFDHISDIELFDSDSPNKKKLPAKVSTVVLEDNYNNIWIGTIGNGLFYYDQILQKMKAFDLPNKKNQVVGNNQSIISGAIDDNDILWLSSRASMNLIDSKTKKSISSSNPNHAVNQLANLGALALYKDSKKNVWVGTAKGIYLFDQNCLFKEKFVLDESNTKGWINNIFLGIAEDQNGNMWFGSMGAGLYKLDYNNKHFINFSEEQGLCNNNIMGMRLDHKNNLWLSTINGLSAFQIKDKRFRNFSTNDGLSANEFSQNGHAILPNNIMLFGSVKGLIAFHPDTLLKEKKNDAQVFLNKLSINYQDASTFANSEKYNNLSKLDSLNLKHTEKMIAFEFATLNYANHSQVFQYKLEGFDNDWINSPNKSATYTNLNPGNYLFKARVSSDKKNWSANQLEIPIEILPPFWKTNWFRFLIVFIVLAITYLLARYLTKRKLDKQIREMELKHKLQLERERISRDLHDNVGSNLAYIISTLDHTAYQTASNEETQLSEKISDISEYTRKTVRSLRESIWLLNKENINLSEFRMKIQEQLHNQIGSNRNMAAEVLLDADCENKILKPYQALNIFRIIQESCNNTLKHANAKNFQVKFHKNRKHLILQISDDGTGFFYQNKVDINGHFGLKNMKTRAAELNGIFSLESELNKGTIIKILLPY